ncbi:PEP/pyruvate-binding domain-containing protein [candidate division CSSED10-310 bacterium]|uniref:Phosphoenolpyruvate synthase n=1 Tax=candidate division CSSED10-310 bacterium TaxID=2855610 RepID=A0ABV6Z2T3_UNCC1
MNEHDTSANELLAALKERAKELNCLYQVEEILNNNDLSIDEMLQKITRVLPPGWRYPLLCQVKIIYNNRAYQTESYLDTEWTLTADIVVQGKGVGRIYISYQAKVPRLEEGFFQKEEKKLIATIADRIGQTILHRQLMPLFQKQQRAEETLVEQGAHDWRVVLDLLSVTDQYLFFRVSRRMLNYLYSSGVKKAQRLLKKMVGTPDDTDSEISEDGINRPIKKKTADITIQLSDRIFQIASKHLNDEVIFSLIQKWIKENKFNFLINVLENQRSTLSEITEAIDRYRFAEFKTLDLSSSTVNLINAALIRRFFSRRLEVITLAKKVVSIDDFYTLSKRLIYPVNSNGRLGGKSTGLFMAMRIIKKEWERYPILKNIKEPTTWYVASDGLDAFIHYNHMEELRQHKYRDIELIRMEYPNMVQLFKNSSFPPDMVNGLAKALYDFGDSPIIVRSSSLLEDSIGATFSGKYKSLFLANQGTKKERLDALLDAISEVYASVFSPDAIEYRAQKGLLDFQEEMGIMIQEVVGNRVGKYLLPIFGGVAFSSNDFRWSSRIKRKDGLIRIVPGLGTRAVDRLKDDYPVLISPGQPNLRVNIAFDEIIRYSPQYMDVINLHTNSFETIKINDFLREYGPDIPRLSHVFSVNKDGCLHIPSKLTDFRKCHSVVTFESLLRDTQFVDQINTLLNVLGEYYGMPIDIEFASDDKDFYLLQCRPQTSRPESRALSIPTDIKSKQIIFSANKYVSNGVVPDITHIVYVDPEKYEKLESIPLLQSVGRAVSRLNTILPKRQFILMGPGRWGSRGDIKLGVNVSYSDINNTAVLIEIAFKKGAYMPDLSFGTHFFQDLVEANIKYLPLYPDDPRNKFNFDFLTESENILPELLPEFAHLDHVVRVIDVPRISDNLILRILMNGDKKKALGFLVSPKKTSLALEFERKPIQTQNSRDEHWKWRLRMAEKIAHSTDPQRFGVKGMYVFGSAKNASAGPLSDIDLLVHFEGTADQLKALNTWLEGWSLCLSEFIHLKTGYKSEGLLDVHIVTSEDIINKTSYAVKIGAVSDAARPLPLMKKT